jgi:hypothetical protein
MTLLCRKAQGNYERHDGWVDSQSFAVQYSKYTIEIT